MNSTKSLPIIQEELFSSNKKDDIQALVDDDRVLPMSDGGFFLGEIIEVDAEDHSKVIGIYNSALDPNAVTVEEAKKIMSGEKSYISFSPRGATPPTGWSMKILAANDEYISDVFSGSGW